MSFVFQNRDTGAIHTADRTPPPGAMPGEDIGADLPLGRRYAEAKCELCGFIFGNVPELLITGPLAFNTFAGIMLAQEYHNQVHHPDSNMPDLSRNEVHIRRMVIWSETYA